MFVEHLITVENDTNQTTVMTVGHQIIAIHLI